MIVDLPTFKIRCHAIGSIMGGVNKPTAKQLLTIADYESRPKLNDKQAITLKELQDKRDAKPCLQEGAKKYCEEWVKERVYGIKKEFSNKYTEKGILCEDSAIELVCEMQGYGLVSKNTERKEDADIEGEADLVVSDSVEDVKNSWSIHTFPLFEDSLKNKDYFFQEQGYMALWNKPKGAVNYCLIDAPEEIMLSEARWVSRKAGFDEIDMELYNEVRAKMMFSHLPKSLRYKRFEFDRDDVVIAAIREQVRLCRNYIDELAEKLKQL